MIPEITFEKHTFPNGLDLILHIDRKLPIVHVNHWFHVGSKNEKPGRTGFAHLFEHIMFEGSKHAPDGYFPYIERAGANLREGGVNGTTSNDRTNYFATVPSGNLEYVLWLESDRVATLANALTQENFDNQRAVVRNERRQSYENQPYGSWLLLLSEHLFPAGHPYSWPVIGSHQDLEAATLDDARLFFQTYYTPNNLSLVIAGDFEPDEARRLVERYYGGIPAGPPLSRPARWAPRLSGEKIIEVQDRAPQERVYMVWPGPPRFAPDEAALDIAGSILSAGLSSRLKKMLVYDQQLCTDVFAVNSSNEIAGAFIVMANARPGASLAQIEQMVTDELTRLAMEGPAQEEVSRALTQWEYQFISGLERIGGFGGKADRLNESNTYKRDPGFFLQEFKHFKHLREDDIGEAVDEWLNTRNRLLLRFHPDTSRKGKQNIALDRSKAPPFGMDKRFHPPEVLSHTLENGMDLFVVERPELPKVSVIFAVQTGSVADPAGKEGLSHLMLATIDKGTRTQTALEIAEAFGNLGATLCPSVWHESSSLSFEALKRHLEQTLALFSDVARHPLFPESECERETQRHLDHLAQQANTPTSLAARIGPMLLFGHDHPYGRPAPGLPTTVQTVSRADIARQYDLNWRQAKPALILMGDITMDEAIRLAQQHLSDWPRASVESLSVPEPKPGDSHRIYLLDRPGAPQTVVRYMLPAPERATPDFYALRLVDIIWGGSFGSRLNRNLREEKGFTYGIRSAQVLHASYGMWWAQGAVQADKTGETLIELAAEVRGLAGDRPITEEELVQARVSRIRGYAQQFESLKRIGGQIADLWSSGLPMSELQRIVDEVENVSLEAANHIAQKYADPERVISLVAGDRAIIEPQVRDIGEVVALDEAGLRADKKDEG